MDYETALEAGKRGGNILICGAGFSANSLNFNNEHFGVGGPLLSLLNRKLGYNYQDLQLAADAFIEDLGEHELFKLLKERFSIKERPLAASKILKYRWDRIYTTNYDDLISQTLADLKRPHQVINNLESTYDYKLNHPSDLWIVHLHGSMKKWNFKTFRNSCVLGRESYFQISKTSQWTAQLREDFASAKNVFFIGFSNNDFYLANELYDSIGSKSKVFFINREEDIEALELIGAQKKFGTPLFLNIDDFARKIEKIRELPDISPPHYSCFTEFKLPELVKTAASVDQQEAFLISGRNNIALHYKDYFESKTSYRARRIVAEKVSHFASERGTVSLIIGGICSGKTTILTETMMILSKQFGLRCFLLEAKYSSLLSEAKDIIERYSNSVLFIDDCFTLRNEVKEIVLHAEKFNVTLVLASRTLARDAEEDIREILSVEGKFKEFDSEVLMEDEVYDIIECADRIAGWGGKVANFSQKKKIVESDGNSRLSGFLLYLFNSEHIRRRFKADMDSLFHSSPKAEEVLILALYLRHVGELPQKNVISEMLGGDCLKPFRATDGQFLSNSYLDENTGSSVFKVIASANARVVLKDLISDQKKIVTTVVQAIRNLEQIRFDGIYKNAYAQFMRYTNLKGVIKSPDLQNEFFDRLSELPFCRKHFLYWLQWSMAMRDQKKFIKAQQYLDEAYKIGERMHNFDPYQVDDQQAGLIMESLKENSNSGECLRSYQEVMQRLIRCTSRDEQTSHPYTTIELLPEFIKKIAPSIHASQKSLYLGQLNMLKKRTTANYQRQSQGYIKGKMEEAEKSIESCFPLFNL